MRISDWSSDVCSSDLEVLRIVGEGEILVARRQRTDLVRILQAAQEEADGILEAAPFVLQLEEVVALPVGDLHGHDEVQQAVILIVDRAPPAPHGKLQRALLADIVERRVDGPQPGADRKSTR